MIEPTLKKISESDEYKALVETRKKANKPLALAMLLVYYVYILVIAFSPETLATPIGDGPTTLGIVVGLGIILFTFVITGIAVHTANKQLEPLTDALHKKLEEGGE